MSITHPIPTDGSAVGPSGIPLPHTRISRFLDAIINGVGEASSWIWTALMLLIVYQVVQRYAFGLGSIKMEEMQWHLYGIGFMLAIPFAEIRERHVRIDVLAEHWPLRRRLWVEAFGLTFFLLPFSLFVLWHSVPYATQSYTIHEISSAPDGLPYRFVIKAFLAATFLLLAMAAISRLSRVIAALRLKN
jgi:TRAP-type mannitol/chloroaromatic compound transport system permease small subunit